MNAKNALPVRAAMALTIAACAMLSSPAQASILTFEADLDGLQEVPPNAGPAFGLGEFSLDDVTGALTVTTGAYQDLLGNSTAATINDAAIGMNGSSIFTLTLDTIGAATGTFSGGGMLTSVQVTDAKNNLLYINIQSNVFPSGEIRGQLIQTPEPGSLTLCLLGAGIALFARRRMTRAR